MSAPSNASISKHTALNDSNDNDDDDDDDDDDDSATADTCS